MKKTLNLAYPDQSEIPFTMSNFPDGQQDILISSLAYIHEGVEIASSFKSFRDLELIICATKALRRMGAKEIDLYIPYLLGARSDRQFVTGGTSYLVDVIAPILNAQNYDKIIVMDVHSPVANACINNFFVASNRKLVTWALKQINNGDNVMEEVAFVSPDAGSLKKIYDLAHEIQFTGEIITCSKSRDTQGKLTKTVVPSGIIRTEKDWVIIDDICDGGRTFINIVNEMKRLDYKGKFHLIVTHGIFSNDFRELAKCFDSIFCTNSFSDIENKKLDIQAPNLILKQLNIFG